MVWNIAFILKPLKSLKHTFYAVFVFSIGKSVLHCEIKFRLEPNFLFILCFLNFFQTLHFPSMLRLIMLFHNVKRYFLQMKYVFKMLYVFPVSVL